MRWISTALTSAQAPGADEEVDADDGAQDRSAEERVGQAVADIAHAPEHHVNTDVAAHRPHDDGGDHAVAEELVSERLQHQRPLGEWGRSPTMIMSPCWNTTISPL